VLRDFLMPEAEAEDGNLKIVDRFGVLRVLSTRCQAGAARNDDAAIALERFDRVFGLPDFGPHATPSNLGGDQMGVLTAEVDDGDGVVLHCGSGR
jgi:hypothetical protein